MIFSSFGTGQIECGCPFDKVSSKRPCETACATRNMDSRVHDDYTDTGYWKIDGFEACPSLFDIRCSRAARLPPCY